MAVGKGPACLCEDFLGCVAKRCANATYELYDIHLFFSRSAAAGHPCRTDPVLSVPDANPIGFKWQLSAAAAAAPAADTAAARATERKVKLPMPASRRYVE